MRFLRSLLAFGIIALPLCTQIVDYSLDIKPQTGDAIYEMSINSTVTFQAQGSGKNAETNEIVSVEISRSWWNFDKNILVKVSSDKESITLKAVKSGVSKLTVNIEMNNQPFTKSITILVK